MRKTTWLCAAVVFSVSCDLSPVSWSPDGKRFAFTVMKLHPREAFIEEAAICVYDIDTDKSSILHRTKRAALSAPSFAPDGKTIAFLQESELVNDVVTILFRVMPADGGDPVTIGSTRWAVGHIEPGWLHNLAGIAPIWLSNAEILVPDYRRGWPKNGNIALNVKTRERRSVLETPDWPALSPDAKRLLFCDPDTFALRIKSLDDGALEWVAGVDPTKPNRGSFNYGPFNRGGHLSTGLAWSPDGEAIYGVRDEHPEDGQSDDLIRLDLRSGEVTRLFTGDTPRTVKGFSASSDGRRLVVIKKDWPGDKDLGAQLILFRTGGADDEPQVVEIDGVTDHGGVHVSWSPTDTHFVVRTTTSAASTGKTRFQMFDAEGKLVRIIDAPDLGEVGE